MKREGHLKEAQNLRMRNQGDAEEIIRLVQARTRKHGNSRGEKRMNVNDSTHALD